MCSAAGKLLATNSGWMATYTAGTAAVQISVLAVMTIAMNILNIKLGLPLQLHWTAPWVMALAAAWAMLPAAVFRRIHIPMAAACRLMIIVFFNPIMCDMDMIFKIHPHGEYIISCGTLVRNKILSPHRLRNTAAAAVRRLLMVEPLVGPGGHWAFLLPLERPGSNRDPDAPYIAGL